MIGTYLEAEPMLSKGKKYINVIIVNIHSPDLNSFGLLGKAVALDVITICKYLFDSSTYDTYCE